jgi:replication factor A1
MQLTSEQIFNIIKKQSGKSDEELKQKLEEIKAKYEGLLSDVGANILLSKQLNIDLELKQSTSAITKISEISPTIDSVSLYARVKSIPPLKIYKSKDGSDGKIQAIYLEDETGLIKLNLWQDKAEIVKELNLEKNDLLFVKDAGINQYNEKIELSLRQGGQIIKDPEGIDIPKIKDTLVKISEINQAPTTPVDTIARIISIYPIKTFTKEEKERQVINFEVSDGVKSIRCVAFDTWAKEISTNFSRGDLIRLNDVTIKDGLYDLELYINWNSTISKDPKTKITIPPLSELTSTDVQEEKIANLENNKTYKISGTVVSINKGNLRSFKCPECKEKVFLINDEFICESCNKPVDPDMNIFSSLNVDDGTGIIRVSLFNQLLEEAFDLKKEDLKKDLTPEEKDGVYYKAENKLFGKHIVVTGKAKQNDFSNQLEFMASTLEVQ